MNHGEQRIVEFLISSNATAMADLPDWLLALVEGKRGEELSHELITAASLMLVRRENPGIAPDTAWRLLVDHAGDQVKLEDLMGKIQAFRLSCSIERLRRAGFYEEISTADPFDLNGQVSVRLSEEAQRFFDSNPTKQEIHIQMQKRWGRN